MSDSIIHISVIELDFHHDSLDGFLKIFEDTKVRVSAFTTAKNIELLKNVPYAKNITFYPYAGGGKYFFLKKHLFILNSSQIVFINTIANDFGAYRAIDTRLTTILRVHNVNKQFSPLKHISFPRSFFFAWKFFSYIARQVIGKGFWFYRPMVNRRMSHFVFPDQGITDYVKEQHFIPEKKILAPIPLKIFRPEDTAFEPVSGVLNITIIGATDRRRRQYEEVMEGLKILFSQKDPPTIYLTLLGNCNNSYGKIIIEQLKSISHPDFKFKTYLSQVPEKEFIECIKHTHLIISPITTNATTDIFKEVYGKTKTTGSILDFLKFGKVTLVPQHYTPPTELRRYILKYENSAQFSEIILDLLTDKKINDLNRTSLDYVTANYSQEIVLKNTLSVFNSLVKND